MKNKKNHTSNAIKFMTIIACFSLLFLLTKCKRETNEKLNPSFKDNNITSTPVALSEDEIENQMRWIAKGYAYVYDNSPSIFSFLQSHLSLTEYYEDAHEIVNPEAITDIAVDLEDEVHDAVDIIDNSNDYDRDYFMGFEFEECNFTTMIRIVDEEDANPSLPVLFTYQNKEASDTTWGYFWNSGLDSVLLHSLNYEDYFIFAIYPERECVKFERRTSRDCEIEPCCNLDNICEPMQGETAANCIDCQNLVQGTAEKDLKVIWVRINEDKKMFDENWIGGKYTIIWDFVIASGTTGLIQNNRDNFQYYDLFEDWKRKQVPINRKSLKGNVTHKAYSGPSNVMYRKFVASSHDIYITITEKDRRGNHYQAGVEDVIGNPIIIPSSYSQFWDCENKGGSFHTGGSFNWGGLIHVPAGSTWVAETIDGHPHMIYEAFSPHGEITIKLAYKL